MRSAIEYETRAEEFGALAKRTRDPALRKRYADLAACYRLLAADRRRLIDAAAFPADPQSAAQLARQEKKKPP